MRAPKTGPAPDKFCLRHLDYRLSSVVLWDINWLDLMASGELIPRRDYFCAPDITDFGWQYIKVLVKQKH